jgi:hypothetical protein
MRYWIVLLTICSLLSLPFSGSVVANNTRHSEAMQSAPEHHPRMSEHNAEHVADDAEHCPMSMPLSEVVDDCCDDTTDTADCGKCPPDCGQCAMSDHGSTAALSMQQTFTPSVVSAAVADKSSFYQRLSGQPTPPPIIS